MMILRSAPPSPFVRKIRIVAAYLGLENQIEIQQADTTDPDDSLRLQNPLGKIPALLFPDGAVMYDSRVILEYLDHMSGGGRIIPTGGKARFDVLTLQALADGIMDAAILQVYEKRWREEAKWEAKWLTHQAGKVERGLQALEAQLAKAPTPPMQINVGTIAAACALGYLDLRFDGAWRANYAALASWLEQFSQAMPAFQATRAT